jgi:hypothetical protein
MDMDVLLMSGNLKPRWLFWRVVPDEPLDVLEVGAIWEVYLHGSPWQGLTLNEASQNSPRDVVWIGFKKTEGD